MYLTKKLSVAFLAVAFIVSSQSVFAQKAAKTPAKPAAPSFGNVDGISAKQLREYLTFIASDELEGRDTPSRGLDIAAMFIVSAFMTCLVAPWVRLVPIRRWWRRTRRVFSAAGVALMLLTAMGGLGAATACGIHSMAAKDM